MKKVEAIIRPEKFKDLREKLSAIGFDGLTVTEAAGTGKQKGKIGIYRSTEFEVTLLSKLKVELVISDERLDDIVGHIIDACITGQIGDGKIFISPIEQVIRIRTGESGTKAIY
ncbi:P-II family nitrogen regulator [Oceanobacillus jeddahense]|uniref:P-II family nitrogen regulator n=1 Tax=Oceanobacillus jeddahense TaxID=1462527 RepID=A0ABY5JQP9_9BACI|nr:P-II family nitrogen regulator [Oceanobacillus jeddahense]UUI01797.1 P-II family nitrogen regulator [Oceanobacillus jeddahense]